MKTVKKRIRTRAVEIPDDVKIFVGHSMAIAKQIHNILQKKELSQMHLALKLNKKDSEISRWLSGTHNFTLKTISKIEDALDEKIILVETKLDNYI